MGTDYPSFILEADRTLRPQGRIVVAEVRSRFEDKADTEHSLFADFQQCMKRVGSKLTETLHSNKMFLVCVFQKGKSPAAPPQGIHWPVLKPCIYRGDDQCCSGAHPCSARWLPTRTLFRTSFLQTHGVDLVPTSAFSGKVYLFLKYTLCTGIL